MIKNINENVITPETPDVIPNEQITVYVPIAGNEQLGIANFYNKHFIVTDGRVEIKSNYIKSILADNFQLKHDENLITTNKTVVGAISELSNNINEAEKRLNNNITESLDRSVRYIRYVANTLINKPNSGVTVESVPSESEEFVINGVTENFNLGDEYKGNFTVSGMTEYLTADKIDVTGDDLFFAIRRSIIPDWYGGQLGFKINLPEKQNVEILQLYLWGVYQDLTLNVYTYDGTTWSNPIPLIIEREAQSSLNIYRVHINDDVTAIKIVQEGNGDANHRFIVKGVELFGPTTDGYFELIQRNNVTSKWDTFNAKTLVENINTALSNSEKARDEAARMLNNKGMPGGWPELDSSSKIFANYIPSIVKTDYEIIDIDWSQITDDMSELEANAKIDELADEQLIKLSNMEQGDIAALIKYETDDEGYLRGKIIKSWMLLGKSSLSYASVENWYEQSVATAGSAAFAKQADNANNSIAVGGIKFEGPYTLKEYNTLLDEGKINDDIIYVVEE